MLIFGSKKVILIWFWVDKLADNNDDVSATQLTKLLLQVPK